MTRFKLFTISLLLCVTVLLNAQTNNTVLGEYIVWLKAGQKIESVLATNPSLTVKRKLARRFDVYLLATTSQSDAMLDNAMVANLKRNNAVALAQHNHNVQNRATTPNDPNFNQQYSLRNTGQSGGTAGADIDATLAWDITTGGATIAGDTIVIAVIDGGFQLTHNDLRQNIFRNTFEIANNNIDDDNNGYVDDVNGWDAFADDGSIPNDFHGTHVSGIISARGNNNLGISGVNWFAKILPIAGSSGNEATVVAAYAYAAEMRMIYSETNGQRGAFVVATNSSFGVDLGDPNDYPIWCAFYDTLGVRGILSAGATANANYNVDTQGDIPTACASNFLVSVTNTTRTDAKNNSCGFGATTIDLGSPGTDVYSLNQNNGYQNATGTSMATPQVAGVIGLMYAAACPELIAEYKSNPGPVALQFKQFMLDGVDPVASMANITVTGGRLNAYNALVNVQAFPCDPTAPPTAAFAAPNRTGCPGIQVQFNNNSSFNAESYTWSFPGGVPSSSTQENPTVTYSQLGVYDVQLIATNQFGSDTIMLPAYVDVNTNGVVTFYNEDFEDNSLPAIGYTTENPDGQNTWGIVTTQGSTPGDKSIRINIFQNQDKLGQRDAFITNSIDFSQNTNIQLAFEHAHRRRVSTIRDSLIIYVSTDDGVTFPNRVFARAENGQGSFATAGLSTTNFVPQNSDDWCMTGNVGTACLTVDLSAFDGQPNVKLKFEAYNASGNNIYIDNIKLTGNCIAPQGAPPVSAFSASQTVCLKDTVQFVDNSTNVPTAWAWTFEGGTPATSTAQNPSVIYNAVGNYDVALNVTNTFGTNSSNQPNYITVVDLPPTPSVSLQGTALQSSNATFYQWNTVNAPVSGATNQQFTPTQSGTYTVTITDQNGCKSTSNPFTYTVGVNELTAGVFVKAYPNPAKNTLYISIDNGIGAASTLWLTNMLGQTTYTQKLNAGKQVVELTTAQLPRGIYFLRTNVGTSQKVVLE